jgi:hypothetical protein
LFISSKPYICIIQVHIVIAFQQIDVGNSSSYQNNETYDEKDAKEGC